jgi:hypothetical protein
MKMARSFSAILFAILLLSSCAQVPLRPLETGEARLTRMEMPEVVREELPYDVFLTVDAEEMPQVKSVCFRWVSEEISSRSPSLYNYSTGAGIATGPSYTNPVTVGSPVRSDQFCVGPEDIRSDVPGRLIVRIRATNLKADYNRLEGQAEYVSGGRVMLTNKVSTRIFVER